MKRVCSVLLCAALCLGLLPSCGLLVDTVVTPMVKGEQHEAEEAVAKANYRVAKGEAMAQYIKDGETASEKYYDYTVDDNGSITLTPSSSTTDGPTDKTSGTVRVSLAS